MEAEEDYKEYECEDSPAGDDPEAHSLPVTPLQLFDRWRNYSKREAPKAAKELESRVHLVNQAGGPRQQGTCLHRQDCQGGAVGHGHCGHHPLEWILRPAG